MDEEYPLSHIFGEFPPNVMEDLCKGVAKREVELTALRNIKNVKSSSIEGLLAGPGQPFSMIGYDMIYLQRVVPLPHVYIETEVIGYQYILSRLLFCSDLITLQG
ncbi:MAG: hypothetical protein HOF02_00435 [Gammaproteobacteria bacterium]|jgi:hypothetical protein|nr:hypothetical protein [Gammaproteobacteria bacterium]MBT5224514.1 hypothetical protein [Candidatus Neomarinimicrobiota bacterium]